VVEYNRRTQKSFYYSYIFGNKFHLIQENLSKLLKDVEQNLTTLGLIEPDNIEHSIKYFICFSKVRRTVMNIAYITLLSYIDRSLDRRLQLRGTEPEGPIVEIIDQQRQVGDLQTRISFYENQLFILGSL